MELPFIVYSILKQCWSVGYVSLLTLSFIVYLLDKKIIIWTPRNQRYISEWLCILIHISIKTSWSISVRGVRSWRCHFAGNLHLIPISLYYIPCSVSAHILYFGQDETAEENRMSRQEESPSRLVLKGLLCPQILKQQFISFLEF